MGKKEKLELIAIGFFLVVIAIVLMLQRPKASEEMVIRRPGSGGKKQTLYLSVGDLQETFSFRVKERERTKEELEQLFQNTHEEIEKILNPDGADVIWLTHSLELPEECVATGAFLEWDSSEPGLLSKKGEVNRGSLTEETEVTLMVRITLGEERREEWFSVWLLPLLPESGEHSLYLAGQYLERLEEETRYEDSFTLPKEYEGVSIRETEEKKKWYLLIPVAFFLIPVLVLAGKRQEQEKQKRLWEKELLAAYPQLITKLTLYVGAGLSLRNAWERLAAEYRERRKKTGKNEAVYEEILMLTGELKNGTPEAKAYEALGRRLELRPYQRCMSLLIGQLEKGAGGLREKLEYEVRLAWDKHRLRAEAVGSEAQTKLLFPMMGMLFLVFAIVMLPAFFQMGL